MPSLHSSLLSCLDLHVHLLARSNHAPLPSSSIHNSQLPVVSDYDSDAHTVLVPLSVLLGVSTPSVQIHDSQQSSFNWFIHSMPVAPRAHQQETFSEFYACMSIRHRPPSPDIALDPELLSTTEELVIESLSPMPELPPSFANDSKSFSQFFSHMGRVMGSPYSQPVADISDLFDQPTPVPAAPDFLDHVLDLGIEASELQRRYDSQLQHFGLNLQPLFPVQELLHSPVPMMSWDYFASPALPPSTFSVQAGIDLHGLSDPIVANPTNNDIDDMYLGNPVAPAAPSAYSWGKLLAQSLPPPAPLSLLSRLSLRSGQHICGTISLLRCPQISFPPPSDAFQWYIPPDSTLKWDQSVMDELRAKPADLWPLFFDTTPKFCAFNPNAKIICPGLLPTDPDHQFELFFPAKGPMSPFQTDNTSEPELAPAGPPPPLHANASK